jgi:hypothetical protein
VFQFPNRPGEAIGGLSRLNTYEIKILLFLNKNKIKNPTRRLDFLLFYGSML